MHVPGWHEATKEWQDAGDLQMVGIIQEQHPDRSRLFMQWKEMDWPILVDSLNLLETTVVPLTLAIDEHGVIRKIQPPRDDLDAFRTEFLDVEFEAPPATAASPPPAAASLPQPPAASPRPPAASPRPMSRQANEAVSMYLWERAADPDAVIRAFERAVAAAPGHGYTLFRTGVAYRWRYDSPSSKQEDFQEAVRYWERALDVDPNNYIWRRRIQQYGPRLEKPYPFYDWVPTARAQIAARGETPVALLVEPGGAEFASPQRTFAADTEEIEPPTVDERIYRDDGEFVSATATMVPGVISAGGSSRAHVSFVPNEAIKAHWNNEVDGLVFWIDVPDGWQVDRRAVRVPNPPEVVSRETRKVELEIKAPDDARGRQRFSAYALYYVCEDVNGVCLYRRQDVTLTLNVKRR